MADDFLLVPERMSNGDFQVSPVAPHLKLLIVEDVLEDIQLIVWSLETAGLRFSYEGADSLEQCEDLLKSREFDAILADYRLPGLHAPELLQIINTLQLDIPFILVTGSLGEEAAVECIKSGMTDYVLKNGLYRLPTVLKRALREAELKRQRQAAIAQTRRQAWRDHILNQIIQVIRETLVLDEVLQKTVDQLRDALRVDRCIMAESVPDHGTIVKYVSYSPTVPGHGLLNQSCDLCTYFEQPLRAGQQIEIQASDPSLRPETVAWLSNHRIHSVLLTALNYQQHHFGVLALQYVHDPNPWTEIEISLVKSVAEQCAIAIYQAKLYDQAQRELEQRQRVEYQLRYDAFHDGLTGLPNRALFLDRLSHVLDIAHRHQAKKAAILTRRFAVLCLDLDDFRIVNDSLGHDLGDCLIQAVAMRLAGCLRVGDTLARTSGDEFAILLEDIAGVDDVTTIVEHCQNALETPIVLESQQIFVSACIGIVVAAPHYNKATQLLRDADTAMYRAKARGRGEYQIFNGSMHVKVRQRLQLESDLRRAIDRQEFTLSYQPIVHLPTQRFCGFEALIRWRDPIRGTLAPDNFIPTAEQTGLIIPIGQWVLRQACQQWKHWQSCWPDQMQAFRISVNLSAKQFAQPFLIEQIDAILSSTGIDGTNLRVEVTESALIDREANALDTLKKLRAMKIQVILDDFGTGYSSLSYLLRFPKDGLKIDKSFVFSLENSIDNQNIIKTIITLGNNLGLDVVAEGIETEQQAKFLLSQGCVFGQGYYYSKPLTSQAVEDFFQRGQPLAPLTE